MTKIHVSHLLQPDVFVQLFPWIDCLGQMLKHKGWDHESGEFEKLYVPSDHPDRNQLRFHESQAMHRLLLGGNQAGKSRAGAEELAWLARGNHPHLETREAPVIWVVSAQYTNLENGIYRHLLDIIPPWEIKAYGQKVPHTAGMKNRVDLWNGTVIHFKSGSGGTTARKKAQAAEVDYIFIDEEVDDAMYKELQRRLLARGGKFVYTLTAVDSVQWVLDLEDRAQAGDPRVEMVRLSAMEAAEAGHIDKETLLDNIAGATKEEIEVRVYGQTLRNQGLIYKDWDPSLHICEPFEIPADWNRYVGIDPGFNIFAVAWVAVAPNGRKYLYRELYEHAANLDQICDAIYQSEGWALNPHWKSTDDYTEKWVFTEKTERITQRWVDPAEFGNNPGGGMKVGSMMAAMYGINTAPAMNDVEVGIQLCQREFALHLDGFPRMQVFSTCQNWLKERLQYRRRILDSGTRWSNQPKAAPVKRKDHLMDAWRYIIAGGAETAELAEPLHPQYEEGVLVIPAGVDDVTRARFEASNRRLEQQLANRRQRVSLYGMGIE